MPLATLAICLVLSGAASAAPDRFDGRDVGTLPGDDFDRYANGRWRDAARLRADQAAEGSLLHLNEVSVEDVRALLDDLRSRSDIVPGSDEQKLSDLYQSFLDQAARDAAGVEPLRPLLARIAAIDSMPELVEAFGRIDLDGTNTPVAFGVGMDRKDPHRYLVGLHVGGLGLPDRSYYLDSGPAFGAIRAAYVEHVARMLGLAGVPDGRARAEALLAVETKLAAVHWDLASKRDPNRTYNPIPFDELVERHPGLDWAALLAARGMPRPDRVNLVTPDAVSPVVDVIQATPLSTWRDYLTFAAVSRNAFLLSSAIDEASFAFHGTTLSGQEAQPELWRRAVEMVAGPDGLGDAVDRLYVARHFGADARAASSALTENVRAAMRSHLEHLDWLGPETRAEALHKLATLDIRVGMAPHGRDYSSVTIVPGDLVANARALAAYNVALDNRRVGAAPDPEEWHVQAWQPNAYHSSPLNAIFLPAALFQSPLFDASADAALNYGAMGAFIGHELVHAFDDQGSKWDAAGTLRDWWAAEDRARFEARIADLGRQYAAYCPLDGRCVDADLTMGENVADLGGLSIAYTAYRASTHGRAPKIGGLTGDQRFFLAYARVWREKTRPELLLDSLATDPHAPATYRINGVVRNMDAWYDAFGVGPDDALYLPPEARVRIW